MNHPFLEAEIAKFTLVFEEYKILISTEVLEPTDDIAKIADHFSLVYATTKEEIIEYLNVWIDKAIEIKDKRLSKHLETFNPEDKYEKNLCSFVYGMEGDDVDKEYSREFLIKLFQDFYIRKFIIPMINETLDNWDRKITSNDLFIKSGIRERVDNPAFTSGKVIPLFEVEFIKFYTPIFIEGFHEYVAKGAHYNDYFNSKLDTESPNVRKHFDSILPTIFENEKLDGKIADFTSQIVLTIGQVSWSTTWVGHGRMKAEDGYILMNEHSHYKKKITDAITKWRDSEIERQSKKLMGIT